MIPRMHDSGRGVSGLAAYTLYDKPVIVEETGEVHYPGSSDRVAWTATVGLPDIEPTLMVRIMQGVTADAKFLKERAGVSARGRRLATPYGHMSLNWGPDENPTKKEMIGAAREALSAVGIKANHYALIVAHTDTDHPHAHVVFCRIDPETGKAAKLSYSGMRLSSWAERWERKHDGIRIENRVARRKVREHNKQVMEKAQRAGRDVDPADLEKMPPMAPARTRDPHGNSVQRTPDERQDLTDLYARHRTENTPNAQRKTERLELAISHLEKRTTKLEDETAVRPVVEPPRPRPMAVRPAVPEPELVTGEHELAQPPPVVMPSRPAVPEPELVTGEHELAQPPPVVMPSRPGVPEPELVTAGRDIREPAPVLVPVRPSRPAPPLSVPITRKPPPASLPSRPTITGHEVPEIAAALRETHPEHVDEVVLDASAALEALADASQILIAQYPTTNWPHVASRLEDHWLNDERYYDVIQKPSYLFVGQLRRELEEKLVWLADDASDPALQVRGKPPTEEEVKTIVQALQGAVDAALGRQPPQPDAPEHLPEKAQQVETPSAERADSSALPTRQAKDTPKHQGNRSAEAASDTVRGGKQKASAFHSPARSRPTPGRGRK